MKFLPTHARVYREIHALEIVFSLMFLHSSFAWMSRYTLAAVQKSFSRGVFGGRVGFICASVLTSLISFIQSNRHHFSLRNAVMGTWQMLFDCAPNIYNISFSELKGLKYGIKPSQGRSWAVYLPYSHTRRQQHPGISPENKHNLNWCLTINV